MSVLLFSMCNTRTCTYKYIVKHHPSVPPCPGHPPQYPFGFCCQFLRALWRDLGEVGEVISTAVVVPCTGQHCHHHPVVLASYLQGILYLTVHLRSMVHVHWKCMSVNKANRQDCVRCVCTTEKGMYIGSVFELA